MWTRKGETEVKGGFYWRKGDWSIFTVNGKRGKLPSPKTAEYIRVPGVLLVPVVLMVSILYVIFLPLIGISMLLAFTMEKTAAVLRAGEKAVVGRLLTPTTTVKH